METNPLARYLEKDLTKVITKVTVKTGNARETGNPYFYIDITLCNGFTKRIFPKSDESFAWINAFDLLDISNIEEL